MPLDVRVARFIFDRAVFHSCDGGKLIGDDSMSRSVDYRKRNSIYRKRPSIWRWFIPLLLVLFALLLLWLYPMSSFNKQAADYERSARGTNAKTVAAETYDDLDWESGSKTVVINSSDAAVNTDASSLKATSPGSSSVTVVHSNDEPDKFSYERWGYGTYADYVEDHRSRRERITCAM